MDKLDLELDNDEDDEDDEVEEEDDDDDDSEAVYEPEEANDDDDSSDGDVQDGKVIIDDIDGGGPVSDADELQLSSNTVDITTTSSSSTSNVDVKNSIGKDMLSNVYKALLPKRKVALTLENVMKWDLVVALMSSSQLTEAEVAELYHRCTGSSRSSSGASGSRGSSSGSRKEMSLAQFEDFTMQLNRLQEPAAASPPVPLVGTVMESPCSTCNACHC